SSLDLSIFFSSPLSSLDSSFFSFAVYSLDLSLFFSSHFLLLSYLFSSSFTKLTTTSRIFIESLIRYVPWLTEIWKGTSAEQLDLLKKIQGGTRQLQVNIFPFSFPFSFLFLL